ncbi:MAG: cation:proton antiporter [Candidatus Omnitrophica bacterium]|nr:cation:proton antiporter [Candidatus Omnitrophota bacterium]
MKRLRYFIGLVIVGIIFWLIFKYQFISLLEWQSRLLERAFFVLLVCGIFCLFRIGLGPTPADRAVAIDILGILVLGFCAILGIPTGRDWYIDIGIAWALQSFISTLALAKYLEGRNFDE